MRNHFIQGSSHMRKGCFLFGFFVLSNFLATAQNTLSQWNFNSTFTISANGTAPAPSSSITSASILLIGGATATDAAGVAADPGMPNNGLNTASYPAQSAASKTAGIEITVNTSGYNSTHLKFYIRHSGSAAKKVVVQYFNGAVWQDVFTYLTTNTNFSTLQDVDLSAYAFLNNNAAARMRLVTDFSITNMYEGATGAYAPGVNGGTIRYDLITITGNPDNCIGPATIQASGFRLLKSDPTSAQLTLNRGNGMGCLVVCSQSGIPSAPANGANYVANSSFSNGAIVGNGYAVLNTWASNLSIQYFNINNLVAGTKYYVAAYEYSSGSNCYLIPGYVDSFYCSSTVLYPGDIQFVGYDNGVASGGDDAFAITNLKSINPNTSFQIVNSRFEAGAPADTRTNRWYAGGTAIYSDLQTIELRYTGTAPLTSGSVISFDFKAPNGLNIKVNGLASTNFLIASKNVITGNSILSTTGAEQFFLTQGRFTTYGTTATNDQYSLLDGHVLHGISYTNNWVSFSQACSAGTNSGDRQSRIPPDIKCMNLFFNQGGYAYYQTTSPHVGSQGLLIADINNSARWTSGSGTGGNDVLPAVLTTPFLSNSSVPAGTWTGGSGGANWFDCNNWEGRFVPDSTTDAIVPATTYHAEIDINAAAEYNRQAMARSLTINTGYVAITGNASDKIVIYDSLLVGSAGSFTTSSGLDTVIVRGNLQFDAAANIQLSYSGWLSLEGNRLLAPINVLLANATPTDVNTLSINNSPGVRLLKGGFQSLSQLQLLNGVLFITSSNAFHHIGQACGIISPINQFAETNKGWEKSFIDGKVFMHTNATSYYTAPIGNAAKNVFAPMAFQPDNSNTRTYEVSYTAASHPNVAPADVATPPLDRVSKVEYWSLACADANAAATITLYYTPFSHIGGGGNDGLALNDLRIAQYWDSLASGGIKWRLYASGGTNTVIGSIQYGRINYSQAATDLSVTSRNFTFGTISPLNILPVDLLSWQALPQGKQIQLNWKVADETMVGFYTIEKSTDGVHFSTMQTINKSGNNYINYDNKPTEGWNYYRLKATGTDGRIFYSVIEKVFSSTSLQFTFYPNPATDMIWLQLPAAGIVTLYSLEGKMILQRSLPALLNRLNIKPLAKGVYILEYFNGKKRASEKVILH